VVNPDNKVDIRKVTVGDRSGDMWVVSSGLKVGERVITDGFMKVGPGSPVKPAEAPENTGASGGN
jgi:membrane fusion protein (multidrug efflux system)